MNYNEANKIIKNYQPTKGFFDLSEQPKALNKIEYAKILKAQNFLVAQNKDADYIREFAPQQWEKLLELSASLQRAIIANWGGDIFQNNDY